MIALKYLQLLLPVLELQPDFWDGLLPLLQQDLCDPLLLGRLVHISLEILELRGSHEELVALVGLALEEEALGLVLGQHGHRVGHLNVEGGQDAVQLLADAAGVAGELAVVVAESRREKNAVLEVTLFDSFEGEMKIL